MPETTIPPSQVTDIPQLLARNELGEAQAKVVLLQRQVDILEEFLSNINHYTECRRGEIAGNCQCAINDAGRKLRGEMNNHADRAPDYFQCYRHYKNGRLYRIVGFAKDAEIEGREVVLYQDIETEFLYTRAHFFADVEHEGKTVRRFECVGSRPESEEVS